jgi:hypothetical protein
MRKIVCFAALLFISAALWAQESEAVPEFRKVRLGVTASPHLAWVRLQNDAAINNHVHFGGSYGLMIDYQFTENYGLSMGILYSHTGANFRPAALPGEPVYDYMVDLQYLELPVMVKLKTNQIGYWTPMVSIGFVPSINTFKKATLDFLDRYGIAVFDAPFNVGGGFEYAISPKTSIFTQLTYSNGLVNLVHDNDGEKTLLRNVTLRTGIYF